MLPPQERESVEIIGRVETEFVTIQPFHIILTNVIKKKAYSTLMKEARKKYQGNIEVVNITTDGSFDALTLLPFLGFSLYANVQTVTATGDVVQYSQGISNTGITQNMTDAVLNVFSNNRDISEYIIGELEYNLVNSGRFRMVDRRRLDQIRTEQNFQLSGDVSDDSAISIGNMLGANIVITGEISGVGTIQRLIIKALDVKTAQIITMARENI